MKSSRRPYQAIFLALILTASLAAIADLAPWYKWRSVVTNETVCAQTSPGEAWAKEPQPYVDARCQKKATSSRVNQ